VAFSTLCESRGCESADPPQGGWWPVDLSVLSASRGGVNHALTPTPTSGAALSVLSASRGGVNPGSRAASSSPVHLSVLSASRGGVNPAACSRAAAVRSAFSTLCESRGCESTRGVRAAEPRPRFQYSLRVEGV